MHEPSNPGSWSPAIDAILSVGERLTALGSWNWALPKAAVLGAVQRIGELGIGILGGDVYRREGSELVFDYGGWHSDAQPGEERQAFIARSLEETIAYISAYPDEQAFFAIVPNIQAGKEFISHDR
jgi:hypothetical protein